VCKAEENAVTVM